MRFYTTGRGDNERKMYESGGETSDVSVGRRGCVPSSDTSCGSDSLVPIKFEWTFQTAQLEP